MKRLLVDLAGSDDHLWLITHGRTLLAAGLALVILAGGGAVYMALRTADADRLVAHTFEVRQDARRLLSDLQDAETGQRGFLLTANDAYLEPLNRAVTSEPTGLARLRELTSDNPEQQERLKKLEPLIATKLDEMQRTVAFAHQGQHDAAVDIVKTDRGKTLMDSIRAELDTFAQTELNLLTEREAAVVTLRGWLLVLISLSLAIAVALIGMFARSTFEAINVVRERTVALESELKLRRDTEDTLRQAQKMEAVGQLTGGIAHDFNNLLTIILGNLDTMQRRLAELSPAFDAKQLAAALTKPLDLALQGARSAAQLTHRLLAFSRRQTLEPKRLDLNRLVTGMSDLLRRTLGETISLETILAGGLWPTFADPNQVENALVNLCVNARDAMPNGGHLTIETATAYLDEAYVRQFGDVASGQYVLLSVTDSGSGIPPEILARVFEPFFTTKQEGEGSGLGLAMVHGFVKQSGGHIRIYSEQGQGTTVKIYLPRLLQPEQAASTPAAKPVDATPIPRALEHETVLVVEDNHGVREYAKAVLEDLGYRVHEASNAAEALHFLDGGASRLDLLFTDVVLPELSGRELARKAQEMRAGLPVLFTTGYTRNAIVHRGQLDPDVQLLGKPYTQQSLARKVRELLDTKSAAVDMPPTDSHETGTDSD
jgi:signal transduction histidine kinase/ActR/RegA family two-component response regulator